MHSGPPPDAPLLGLSVEALDKIVQSLSDPNWTTTDVCRNVILPATMEHKCSYAELLLKQNPHTSHVSLATCFVSHAWACSFADSVSVIKEFAAQNNQKKHFFWFDVTVVSQHEVSHRSQEWWSGTFRNEIGRLGQTLVILSPWECPIYTTRAWCLWEMFCSIQTNVKIDCRVPAVQQSRFISTLLTDFDTIMKSICSVDVLKAQAFLEDDRNMILGAIQSTVGPDRLNNLVLDQLRGWFADTAKSSIENVSDDQEGVGNLVQSVATLFESQVPSTRITNTYTPQL
eukprot:c8991_g1_i1.p1 GENE.c8991_g1_i1~~c8991_g1_i1.p1  ORF type:complete len:286 (-),score=54.42 c8991_g1_i1:825-1682(-)